MNEKLFNLFRRIKIKSQATGVNENFYNQETGRGRGFLQLERQIEVLKRFGFSFVNGEDPGNSVVPEAINDGLLTLLKARSMPVVLDAPCGLANVGKELVDLDDDLQYVGFDLYPPASTHERISLCEVDLDKHYEGHLSADLILCLYGIRYIDDPVTFINRLIRIAKTDSIILINGVKPIKKVLDAGRTVNFFECQSDVPKEKIEIYYLDDWLVLYIKDNSVEFEATLDQDASTTRSDNPEHMWTDVEFYY